MTRCLSCHWLAPTHAPYCGDTAPHADEAFGSREWFLQRTEWRRAS